MDIIIIEIFLKAFLLCGLLYLFARHEADFSFNKVAIVTALIALGTFFIEVLLKDKIGIFTIIPSAAFFLFMIMRYCWVSWLKGIIITIIFFALNIALTILIAMLIASMFESDNQTETLTDKHNNEMLEGLNVARDILGAPPVNFEGTPQPRTETTEQPHTAAPQPAPTPTPVQLGKHQEASLSMLKYSGFITASDGTKTAMVNGDPLKEGEVISVKYKGSTYKWKLTKINRFGPEWTPIASPAEED